MSYIYLVPVAVFLLFQITFLGTYIAAVLQGHVVPTVPYISDDGTYSPESCVFGQLINIGSVLLGITIYIRYRQIQQLYSHHPDLGSLLLRYNKIAVWFGMASCLGISIVGNFQETNVRIVHFTGAFCCFGCGTVYFWLQALITYLVYPIAGSKLYAHIRLGMAIACTILFILIAVTGVMSHILFKGDNPRQWYPSDGGWYFHVVSSISEWIMATIFCFYILSFTDEFRDVRLEHPELTFISYSITL
ncbi:PREDICTED: DNA damage-regulated autophagy modulator protein 1 [Bactrocera latifrons]|uniref:DNA damage-regulated autophagy modulator protein 1 n=1 Tax=Bactrocera latifrons TaxID=174628 RepID=A0A0K8WK55_BACLA|nr:PREDICTED: DNA damage-regulated autophagy modulator protein 1 [Bactrocera latifrons]